LEKNEDIKVVDKAIFRAEAKAAFLNKCMSNNPFSLLNASNEDLCDISNKLGVCLGSSESTVMANLDLIRDLEMSRKILAIQSCGIKKTEEPIVDDLNEVDSSVHADSEKEIEYDLLDVMVLRKGIKIKHRKNQQKKASPKFRYTPNKKRKQRSFISPRPLLMIGLIWNCQGLGIGSKVQFLKELIRDEKIDFIGLQETQRSHFSESWLTSLAGSKPFAWFSAPPNGRSGGLLVGFNTDVFDVRENEIGEFMIHTLIFHREKISSETLLMCMVLLRRRMNADSCVNSRLFAREVVLLCSWEVILIL
jgi:hypothetical protein